jgi:hypothetical protein
MKTLVVGLLLFSIPGLRPTPNPAPRKPVDAMLAKTHRGGRWYMAESGHAVYCVGPVLTINTIDGGLHKVATYCKGEKPLVLLKE